MSIQSIRDNSQGLMAKIIVGAIAVTFALFGVDAIVGFSSGTNDVASVNGTEITNVQLARSSEMLRRQILSELDSNIDPNMLNEELIQRQALENLITRQLLIDDAEAQNLRVADQRVEQVILQTPAFQAEGVFNRQIYEASLRNIGLTPLDYKNQLSTDLLVQQQRLAVASSAFLTPAEIEQVARLDRQTRNLAYFTIEDEALVAEIDVEDVEVRSYYDANSTNFTTEEQVSVEYLELKRTDFYDQVTIDEAEIQQRYQQEVESYADREERKAAHILIEVNDEVGSDDARLKLKEIIKELDAGADFSELAKQHSDDVGSAESGGDLGFAQRGVFVKEFEQALYELEENQISAIVETQFGMHLIKLLELKKSAPPLLKDIRAELERQLRHDKAEEPFVAKTEELENDAYSAGDLQEPAENLKLNVATSELFTRDKGSGVANHAVVRSAAFSDEVLKDGENSELVQITNDHVVILRVKEHHAAKVREFSDVAEEIESLLVSQKARQEARSIGEGLVEKLRNGQSPAEITQSSGYEWTIVDKVKRNQEDLDPEIVRTLFKMAKPASGDKSITGLELSNGDFAVLTLTKVYDNNAVDMQPQERVAVRQALANQFGEMDFNEYQFSLRDGANINKY